MTENIIAEQLVKLKTQVPLVYNSGASSVDLSNYATKEELNGKADKATTLNGYNISDAYTKNEINIKIEEYINENADLLRGYSGLVPTITASNTSGNITVAANTMTIINELTGETSITLGEPVDGYDNEWCFVISQGTKAQTLVLPNIEWTLGIAPTFAANTTTEVRLHYKGDILLGGWY